MTEVEDYAVRAREALSTAQGGTLHIHGVETLDGVDVLFYDDDGRPTFLCPPDSPVAAAGARRTAAVLCIPASHSAHDAPAALTTLVLAGHLSVVGTEEIRGDHVLVVGLLVNSVVLEQDGPELPTVVHRAIPLANWTTAVPDTVGRTAERILHHMNTAHAGALRTFVAELRGLAESEIIAAHLADLDQRGVDVRWMDGRGAHVVHVRFPEVAQCSNSLAARLRETLIGHSH